MFDKNPVAEDVAQCSSAASLEAFRETYLCRQLDNFAPEPRHTGVYAQGMSALFRKCPGLKVIETQTCCQGTNDSKIETCVQFQTAIYDERWSQ